MLKNRFLDPHWFVLSEQISEALLHQAIQSLRSRLPTLTPVERCKLRSLEVNLVILHEYPTMSEEEQLRERSRAFAIKIREAMQIHERGRASAIELQTAVWRARVLVDDTARIVSSLRQNKVKVAID